MQRVKFEKKNMQQKSNKIKPRILIKRVQWKQDILGIFFKSSI